ncbi:MAG: chromosome segregation protein SMC [Clostridia bacterium]|nr:chromosome segregation protein SMC [Clostridia bacterium]
MNFEKLEIYGFKSFADKVEIKFENGITAIVGPNGCGKSNVADSIRFVMGESSAKSMRGSSMQDVIFNGTEKRKAQSYCEVSLHFNNEKRMFTDLDYDEVVLTRKLYKSGESEYLINKNTCRRKDIVDAFRTIGLGKESYSVIGQGKIDSILSAKPEDRRNVFEESAGISKFKEDKNQSENKLLRVNENLVRINDIISELERQLGPLKNQAENAKIFLELSNRLKELEVNIYVYGYENSSKQKEKIYETIRGIDEELALKQKEFEKALAEYEQSQNQIAEFDEMINNLRDELLNLTVALEKQNGEIKLYNEKISILKERNERLVSQIEQGKFVAENSDNQFEKLNNDRAEAETKLKEVEHKQKTLEASYVSVLDKLKIGEASALSFDTALYSSIEHVGDVKSVLSKFETELESLKERQSELSKEDDGLKSEIRDTDSKIAIVENQILNINKKIEKANEEREEILQEIGDLNEEYNEVIEEVDEKKAEFHTSLSKLNVLTEMKEYNEGFAVSVKRLLEQAHNRTSIGGKVVGVVAELMKVPAKYEVAIEMALGASVQNIVTKNEEDAKALINYLKTNKFGRVTFLPITSMKERFIPSEARAKMNMPGVIGIASDLITFDGAYSSVFTSLLGSTIIVDNIDNAVAFSRATGYSTRLVTLDGDIISPQGSMTGGSRKENNGISLIGRDREIETLKVKLEGLKVEIEKLNSKADELREAGNVESEKLSAKVDEIHELQMEKAKQDEVIEAAESRKDEIESQLSDHEIAFKVVLDKIDFVENEIERISKESDIASAKKSEASEGKKQASETSEKLRSERDDLFQKISEARVELETAKNAILNIDAELERLEISKAENEYKTKEYMLEVQKNNKEIEDYSSAIEEILSNSAFSASAKKVELVREKISAVSDDKKKYQEIMNKADGNKMFLAGEIQRANDKKSREEGQIIKIDTDLENMQNRIWEEYQMTYADAKAISNPEFDNKAGTDEAAEIKRKIQRLGNVNLAAIEDIKTISERYNDLVSQRDDLTKAQTDLYTIINDLTAKMEEKFVDQFTKIRNNFTVIFKELFGGGRADITLEDENNPLECGINIIAEPPGKKLQNITLLSGGEKALTAVAILFSILKLRPMPFCVLDEIEAALDEANVERYAKYLHRYTDETQFIVITHRKPTMELANSLYGVTMEEKGVSKVVSVKLSDAVKLDAGEA